ncbi:hypothetical protein QOT19_23035 [Serratia marcescens]|uniref:hypothetical protein n=1 Tax=Serratia marcescens TaxID=615 RepID=UPI0027301763|nr:hypothetical protein [Serratia marcescens]MDP0522203.1 hypothetical protein [Serratia marcescens]
MGIFKYKNKDDFRLISDVINIQTIYTNAVYSDNRVLGDGWKVLSGDSLGFQGQKNKFGAFYGQDAGYYHGYGQEANVLGKYDENGKLVKIGVSFWGVGTYSGEQDPNDRGAAFNKLNDARDILFATAESREKLASDYFDILLKRVIDFAKTNGLGAKDVIISGHSLGGALVNSLSTLSDAGYLDGWYKESSYVAFSSPTKPIGNTKVLQIGFENDPVYRLLASTDNAAWDLSKKGLLYTAGEHDDTVDGFTNNIVDFNDYYATKYFDGGYFSKSITEKIFSYFNGKSSSEISWAAHSSSELLSALERVKHSDFYDYTFENSTVIFSNLTDELASRYWVEDLNAAKHKGTTFIFGRESGINLLKGGSGNDYIQGGGGDDYFEDNQGINVLKGGEGVNVYSIKSSFDDVSVAFSYDGTAYFSFNDKSITKGVNITNVSFDYSPDKKVGDYKLLSLDELRPLTSIFANLENKYSIRSDAENEWLFSGSDNSKVISTGNNTIHSGTGDDVLYGSYLGDTFIFSGDFGSDKVYNLERSVDNRFIFMESKNILENDNFVQHTTFDQNGDAVLTFGNNNVTLVGLHTLDDVSKIAMDFV